MVVKIIRKWYDKNKVFMYGQDSEGRLYCRDLRDDTDMACVDLFFKKRGKFYYKFVHPKTKHQHFVKRM